MKKANKTLQALQVTLPGKIEWTHIGFVGTRSTVAEFLDAVLQIFPDEPEEPPMNPDVILSEEDLEYAHMIMRPLRKYFEEATIQDGENCSWLFLPFARDIRRNIEGGGYKDFGPSLDDLAEEMGVVRFLVTASNESLPTLEADLPDGVALIAKFPDMGFWTVPWVYEKGKSMEGERFPLDQVPIVRPSGPVLRVV